MPQSRECGYPNWQARKNKITIHRRYLWSRNGDKTYMEWRAYCPCHASLGTWTADSFEKIRQSVVAHIRIAHPSEFAAVVRRNNVKRKLIDHLQNGAPADDETLAVLYELQKACAGKVLSDGLAKLGFTG